MLSQKKLVLSTDYVKIQDGTHEQTMEVRASFSTHKNYRRLVVRYEYLSENFLGILQPKCIKILVRLL